MSCWGEENIKTNNLSIGGQIMTMFSKNLDAWASLISSLSNRQMQNKKISDTLKEDIERKQGDLTLQ